MTRRQSPLVASDFTPRFDPVPLPCGCIAEFMSLRPYPGGVVECHWCRATFAAAELHAWLQLGFERPIFVSARPVFTIAHWRMSTEQACVRVFG